MDFQNLTLAELLKKILDSFPKMKLFSGRPFNRNDCPAKIICHFSLTKLVYHDDVTGTNVGK